MHTNRLTVGDKRRLARNARSVGYFDYGSTLAVRCPRCGAIVHGDKVTGLSVARLLDQTILAHLDDCPGPS